MTKGSKKTGDDVALDDAAETPRVEPAPDPAPAPDHAALQADQIVEEWLSGHVRGGPVARSTPAWNGLQKALPALRQKIAEAILASAQGS